MRVEAFQIQDESLIELEWLEPRNLTGPRTAQNVCHVGGIEVPKVLQAEILQPVRLIVFERVVGNCLSKQVALLPDWLYR